MKRDSEKSVGRLSHWAMYAIVALAAIVFGAFFVLPRFGVDEFMLTGVLVVFLFLVLLGAVAVALWSLVVRFRKRSRQPELNTLIPTTRISWSVAAGVLVLMIVGFVVSPAGSMVINGGEYDNRLWIKTAGMFIIAAAVLITIAILLIVAGYLLNRRK